MQSALGISVIRDPAYAATLEVVQQLSMPGGPVTAGTQPLLGSLFWRWQVPVRTNRGPGGQYSLVTDRKRQLTDGRPQLGGGSATP